MTLLRLITRLELRGSNVIKGIEYEGVSVVGELKDVFAKYASNGSHGEWQILDNVASLYGRHFDFHLLKNINTELIPLIAGGGVSSLEGAKSLFSMGVDRVSINHAALRSPSLITKLADIYGSQAVIVTIEAKHRAPNQWESMSLYGRERSGLSVTDWAIQAQNYGAGEINLISIDRDGTGSGADLELAAHVRDVCNIPLIYGGGINSAEDVADLANRIGVDGVSLASFAHSVSGNLHHLKQDLCTLGVEVW